MKFIVIGLTALCLLAACSDHATPAQQISAPIDQAKQVQQKMDELAKQQSQAIDGAAKPPDDK